MEEARVEALLTNPQHPYTYGLMASIPRLALMTGRNEKPGGRLQEILSMMLALTDPPPGCVFAPRCAHADDRCRQTYPAYEKKRPQHWTTCWRPAKLFGAGND